MKRPLFPSLFRRILVPAVIALCSVTQAYAREPYSRGEKSFGPKVGFVSRNTSALAGFVFEYSLSRHIRLAPQAGIIFRHKDLDGLSIDVDVQFPLSLADERCAFYPLVGIDFTSWNKHGLDESSHKDVGTHINRFGGSAGLGFETRCTSTLKVFVEAKYTIVKTYPGAQVVGGLAFVF